MSINDTITIGLRTTEESCPLDSSTAVITLSNSSHHLTHTAITLISLNNRSSKLIRAWKEGGCRRGIVAQWQSTGGSSQRPWVRFPAAPLFLSSPCRFKGLRTVAAPIVSINDTITIGLRTTEESCPSDSSTAVITLSNSSHQCQVPSHTLDEHSCLQCESHVVMQISSTKHLSFATRHTREWKTYTHTRTHARTHARPHARTHART